MFDENNATAGMDAVLELLGSVGSQGDINGYITNSRIAEAYGYHNAVMSELDARMAADLGVTRAEYDAWVTYMEEQAAAVNGMSEEEYYNNIIPQDNERTAETDNGTLGEEGAGTLQGQQGEQTSTPQADTRGVGEDATGAEQAGQRRGVETAQQPKEEAEGGTGTAPQPVGGATAQETPQETAAEGQTATMQGEPQPIGRGAFGEIYDQFRGKVREAFEFLMRHKGGDLLGVFHREDIGDIDLVWGSAKENMGLEHIIEKHVGKGKDFANMGEAIERIESVIANGKIIQDGKMRYVVSEDGYRVAIRKDFDGESQNWIVTAVDYNRSKEEKGITTNPTSASHGAEGSEVAAPRNSGGKDTNNSENNKKSVEKKSER